MCCLWTHQSQQVWCYGHTHDKGSDVMDTKETMGLLLRTQQRLWVYCYGHTRDCGSTVTNTPETVNLLLWTHQRLWVYCYRHTTDCGSTVIDTPETVGLLLRTHQRQWVYCYGHIEKRVTAKSALPTQNRNPRFCTMHTLTHFQRSSTSVLEFEAGQFGACQAIPACCILHSRSSLLNSPSFTGICGSCSCL